MADQEQNEFSGKSDKGYLFGAQVIIWRVNTENCVRVRAWNGGTREIERAVHFLVEFVVRNFL